MNHILENCQCIQLKQVIIVLNMNMTILLPQKCFYVYFGKHHNFDPFTSMTIYMYTKKLTPVLFNVSICNFSRIWNMILWNTGSFQIPLITMIRASFYLKNWMNDCIINCAYADHAKCKNCNSKRQHKRYGVLVAYVSFFSVGNCSQYR